MDRIDLFRIFARVVECSSFTRAADTLGVPRSSVSAAVQELEERVGARLLYRTTRVVSPTQDGSAFYERCVRLIADVEETENIFRQSALPAGRLRVDVPGRIGRLIVAPALPAFLNKYSEINIDLGVTDRAVNLVGENVDCVVRVGSLADSGLIARAIGELPLINVASPLYLKRYGVPKFPEDLHDHLAINYASPSTGRVEPWEWVEDGVLLSTSMRDRITVNSAEAYIACCLAGLGLIQIPSYDVRHHIEAGELIEVMPNHRAEPMPMTLLYPHRQHLSRRLQVFADWLEALLKRELR
ncbi:LysR family transcriptional regulator [Agrobacterium tumefaciens]|uniref:LysR family transcriptional regulator n=1 Tax=Agrobacterium tumefaciens TaxID=358 RepID=UPI002243AF56|nr:LysR family transcriptional regulator [Agrobacterium tumefaciens]MCW8060455.1 LysR family transcriptional regulator [Agrobacterium tumefaciens]MCW8145899.1 LysR family transcriptional regulator [Agrobacterium tumefaciens]